MLDGCYGVGVYPHFNYIPPRLGHSDEPLCLYL